MLKIKYINLIKYFLIISFVSNSYCQNKEDDFIDKSWKVGIFSGYGLKSGLIGIPTYVYRPFIMILEFQKEKFFFKNDFAIEYSIGLEYNAVKYHDVRSNLGTTELFDNKDIGLNFNCILTKKITKSVDLYIILGTGPHYLYENLSRQSKGLIFSDNLGIGSSIYLNKNYFLDFRLGLRHLSNAGTKIPNIGIENRILFIGIKKRLK
jgi:hypothetical protein